MKVVDIGTYYFSFFPRDLTFNYYVLVWRNTSELQLLTIRYVPVKSNFHLSLIFIIGMFLWVIQVINLVSALKDLISHFDDC